MSMLLTTPRQCLCGFFFIAFLRTGRPSPTSPPAPGGAAPTACDPEYERDEEWQGRWFATAKDAEARDALLEDWARG